MFLQHLPHCRYPILSREIWCSWGLGLLGIRRFLVMDFDAFDVCLRNCLPFYYLKLLSSFLVEKFMHYLTGKISLFNDPFLIRYLQKLLQTFPPCWNMILRFGCLNLLYQFRFWRLRFHGEFQFRVARCLERYRNGRNCDSYAWKLNRKPVGFGIQVFK